MTRCGQASGALTTGFDQTRPLLIGLGWLLILATAVAVSYRWAIAPATAHHQYLSTIDSERTAR